MRKRLFRAASPRARRIVASSTCAYPSKNREDLAGRSSQAAARHLWDDRRTDIAIVFVGGGDCYQVLSREPMLNSRVYVWQEFRRMAPAQVLTVIPAFHAVWEDIDPEVIGFADTHAGHGNFRSWAKLTAHTVSALGRLDRDQVDHEVLGWVFAKMSGRSSCRVLSSIGSPNSMTTAAPAHADGSPTATPQNPTTMRRSPGTTRHRRPRTCR